MDEPGHQEQRPSQPWVWAALVAFALVAVTAGAIVGMVATEGRDADSAALATTGATDASPTAGLPPTVPIPAATDFPDTGAFETIPTDTGGFETIPTDTLPTPDDLLEWPPGSSGFTVVLSSTPESEGQSKALAVAQQAIDAGLPSVGVLRSSDYSSLRPGWWVVFSGVYATLREAQAAMTDARASGFPSAYSRTITP